MLDESPERKTGAKLFPKVCVVVYVVLVVADHKINVSGLASKNRIVQRLQGKDPKF